MSMSSSGVRVPALSRNSGSTSARMALASRASSAKLYFEMVSMIARVSPVSSRSVPGMRCGPQPTAAPTRITARRERLTPAPPGARRGTGSAPGASASRILRPSEWISRSPIIASGLSRNGSCSLISPSSVRSVRVPEGRSRSVPVFTSILRDGLAGGHVAEGHLLAIAIVGGLLDEGEPLRGHLLGAHRGNDRAWPVADPATHQGTFLFALQCLDLQEDAVVLQEVVQVARVEHRPLHLVHRSVQELPLFEAHRGGAA